MSLDVGDVLRYKNSSDLFLIVALSHGIVLFDNNTSVTVEAALSDYIKQPPQRFVHHIHMTDLPGFQRTMNALFSRFDDRDELVSVHYTTPTYQGTHEYTALIIYTSKRRERIQS